MSFTLLGRRALAPGGGVVTVATMSMAWTGERSGARFSSQLVAGKIRETTVATTTKQFWWRRPPQPQRYSFASSTKPSATTNSTTKTTAASSATTSASETKSSGSFVDWYEGHLHARPVVTKMFTGCFLWGVGDVVAQVVPQFAMDKESKEQSPAFQYDVPRTGRAVLFGFALHAPTSHVHYNFLEWLTNRLGITGLMIPVFKTVMEQFVYWGWVSNAMYLAAMGAMQGHSSTKIYDKIHDSLWGLMKAQWAFWIPVQLLNFQFVPVRHQLNVVLITSVVWTALLSFWYPPEPKATKMLLDDVIASDDENGNNNNKEAKEQ